MTFAMSLGVGTGEADRREDPSLRKSSNRNIDYVFNKIARNKYSLESKMHDFKYVRQFTITIQFA